MQTIELPIKGLTLARAERKGCGNDDDSIEFETTDGRTFRMWHNQNCCEDVTIRDIEGDLSDLVGAPLLMAEEAFREATSEECGESGTWTFYKFGTSKGYVTITWLGTSNGYYSESVSFMEVGVDDDD